MTIDNDSFNSSFNEEIGPSYYDQDLFNGEQPGRLSNWFSWRPTSSFHLACAEHRLLQFLSSPIEHRMVKIRENWAQIRTLIVRTEQPKSNYKQRIPIVLLHGMGAGVGLWLKNLDSLAEQRPVYTLDILGFGRSSRVPFPKDPVASEVQLVDSIEEWREQLGLQKFVLLGHSMGGFLACSYALRFPNRVAHLVLVDPWGFPEKPDIDPVSTSPIFRFALRWVTTHNPLSIFRFMGPFGPSIVSRVRSDLGRMFVGKITLDDIDKVTEYIYHSNAQNPSGETAFKNISHQFQYAKNPMINRIAQLDSNLHATFIYGAVSWMDAEMGLKARDLRSDPGKTHVEVIEGAGHHVYAQREKQFNAIVNLVGFKTDIQEGCDRAETNPEDLLDALHKARASENDLPCSFVVRGGRRNSPRTSQLD